MKLHELKNELLIYIRRYPKLFLLLLKTQLHLKGESVSILVSKDTELVLEGYFRSANTFAAYAFLAAQGRDVSLAYHTHAAATIIQAIRWRLPTLVLVREPVDTIASLMLKHPNLTLQQALKGYIEFYSRILPLREQYLVATYDQVIRDFGQVIERLNQRFNTDFKLFEHNYANVNKILAKIERVDRRINPDDIGKLSLPREDKDNLKIKYKEQLCSKKFSKLIEEAQLYNFLFNKESER